jgi:hypothetical protein
MQISYQFLFLFLDYFNKLKTPLQNLKKKQSKHLVFVVQIVYHTIVYLCVLDILLHCTYRIKI